MTSAEFEAFMNQMDSLSARLDKQRAKFEKEKVQIDEKIAEKTKELENKRRKGECGRAWQVLQQRIDMGKTCEEDILAGIDKSPEAREVRGYLAQNMSYVRDSVEDADDEDNEAAQARVALDKGMTRLREWESQYGTKKPSQLTYRRYALYRSSAQCFLLVLPLRCCPKACCFPVATSGCEDCLCCLWQASYC